MCSICGSIRQRLALLDVGWWNRWNSEHSINWSLLTIWKHATFAEWEACCIYTWYNVFSSFWYIPNTNLIVTPMTVWRKKRGIIQHLIRYVTCSGKTGNKSQGRCFQFYLYSVVWPINSMHSTRQNVSAHHHLSIDAVHSWLTPFIIVNKIDSKLTLWQIQKWCCLVFYWNVFDLMFCTFMWLSFH